MLYARRYKMKSSKEGNLLRLIAIFLVAVTLVLTIGFAADGWQGAANGTQNNNQPTQAPEASLPPPPKIPDFLNPLTGLETSEDKASARQICYVLNSLEAICGLSSSSLTVELPCENGESRILAYIDENVTVEPKIGSITKTRDYISNIASFFGGLLISAGNDDTIEYSSIDVSDSVIDLLGHVGYYYTENEKNIYTNKNLIEALLTTKGISLEKSDEIRMPFDFIGYFDNAIKASELARTVSIEYSTDNTTKFSYSSDGEYTVSKNGANIVDTKTGKLVSYENVFVLFADATTYERINGIQTVVDTHTSGLGYYFTEGTKYNIRWYCDDAGSLVFLSDSGTKLTVNRGRSYIAYQKATMYGKILIES